MSGLSDREQMVLSTAATKLQSVARAQAARTDFVRNKTAAITIEKTVRGWNTRGQKKKGSLHFLHKPVAGQRAGTSTGISKLRNLALSQSVAHAMFNKARQANKVERLHGDTRGSYAESYHATREADKRRKALLKDARRLSPIDTVLRLNKLGQTVLGRLLTHSVTWIVIATYAATATCSHYGYLPFTEEELTDRDSFEGSGTLITFMIVFYVRTPLQAASAHPRVRSRRCCGMILTPSPARSRALAGWLLLQPVLEHVLRPRGVHAPNRQLLLDCAC